jgi:hypothetical protein
VETFKFWARPAVVAALWIATASFTLSELTTVVPALRSAMLPPAPARSRDTKQQFVRARTSWSSRAAVAP